ncbi:hypothetical protein C0J52_13082 [Blattella germanica]|nr:hypothetical protein C0J52_13082 [Blattella germanica]
MEIMEEGNMMDRIRILLQRDMGYYQAHQTVLQENLCPGVVGGLLDFPHYASFAAVKLVLWWEEEYVAAFHCPSGLLEQANEEQVDRTDSEEFDRGCGGIAVAKTSVPTEFVNLVSDSAGQLLEHLHTLSQEALDHADLTVLTGTLGAAALIRNCLCLSLHGSYRQYHEMAEALAERLLDLHCRLLSLYVLQDAECLNWEDPRPFFEGERGSFVIQMWWLYMQGTKEDLWNTVPPKMAQRVLAGMLNESLTILTVRYTQAEPSSARSLLLVTDISNLLLCVREILPAICSDASELTGYAPRNKVLRDVHAKCHELLICLVFRRGVDNVAAFTPLNKSAPAPWLVLTSPDLFSAPGVNINNLPDGPAIALEISVLVSQPQALWSLLLKVLTMRQYKVMNIMLNHLMQKTKTYDEDKTTKNSQMQCDGFLCSGGGDCSLGESPSQKLLSPCLTVTSLIHIVSVVGSKQDLTTVLISVIEKHCNGWGACLDKREAMLSFMASGDSSLSDAVNVAMDSLIQLADCLPESVLRAAIVLEDALPADVHPLAGSVLVQLVITVLIQDPSDDPLSSEEVPYTTEIMVSSLLLTSAGRRALKVMWQYLQHSWQWILCQLGILDSKEVPFSTPLVPATASRPAPTKLLHTMFHVGRRQFDQLLAGTWEMDWDELLQTPLALTPDRVWSQLSSRSEFHESPSLLSEHDTTVVATLSELFQSVAMTPVNQ